MPFVATQGLAISDNKMFFQRLTLGLCLYFRFILKINLSDPCQSCHSTRGLPIYQPRYTGFSMTTLRSHQTFWFPSHNNSNARSSSHQTLHFRLTLKPIHISYQHPFTKPINLQISTKHSKRTNLKNTLTNQSHIGKKHQHKAIFNKTAYTNTVSFILRSNLNFRVPITICINNEMATIPIQYQSKRLFTQNQGK